VRCKRRQKKYGAGEEGRLISLTANFRSSDKVVSFVNAVFERAMRGGADEIEYAGAERLCAGRGFEGPRVEMHLIGAETAEEEEEDDGGEVLSGAQAEAYLIAARIHELMDEIRAYDHVLVFQTIGELEDSFDIEGMYEAGSLHNNLSQNIKKIFADADGIKDPLHLGAGGCRVCEKCSKITGEPCRFPDKAMSSLEAYGINVSKLAAAAGMKYINGVNTVTYFGAVFFKI